MQKAVIFGAWGIRHNEPGARGVVVHPIASDADLSLGSVAIDLREHGAANLSAAMSPLALAEIDGDMVHLRAMLTRQDLHACHFIRRGELPSVPIDRLEETVAEVFDSQHIELNNFECCIFPLAVAQGSAICLPTSATNIAVLASDVIAAIDDGRWPGLHLKLGKTIQRFSGIVTVLQNALSGDIVIVRPGTLRKKRGPESTAWRIEVYARSAGSACFRRAVHEVRDADLAEFDQRPENVAGLVEGGPLVKLGTIRETTTTLVAESGFYGALLEIELGIRAIVAPEGANAIAGFVLPRRGIAVRVTSGRVPLETDAIAAELSHVAARLQAMPGARVGAPLATDTPAGLVPAELAGEPDVQAESAA